MLGLWCFKTIIFCTYPSYFQPNLIFENLLIWETISCSVCLLTNFTKKLDMNKHASLFYWSINYKEMNILCNILFVSSIRILSNSVCQQQVYDILVWYLWVRLGACPCFWTYPQMSNLHEKTRNLLYNNDCTLIIDIYFLETFSTSYLFKSACTSTL